MNQFIILFKCCCRFHFFARAVKEKLGREGVTVTAAAVNTKFCQPESFVALKPLETVHGLVHKLVSRRQRKRVCDLSDTSEQRSRGVKGRVR